MKHLVIFLILLFGVGIIACQSDPVTETPDPGGTGGGGTGGDCVTDNMSYQNNIFVIVQNKCLGCHSGSTPQGGVLLDNYTNIKAKVDNGALLGSIEHQNPFTPMPFNQAQLPQCEIDQIKSWINDGALNN